MKLAKTRQKGIGKLLVGAFAFLLLMQTFIVFSLNAGLAHAEEYQATERAAAELCEKSGNNQSHTGNHCSHIGFCVLCSVQERSHESISAAVIQVATIIIRFEPSIAVPIAYFENHRPGPSRQTGWMATWSATAPPSHA